VFVFAFILVRSIPCVSYVIQRESRCRCIALCGDPAVLVDTVRPLMGQDRVQWIYVVVL